VSTQHDARGLAVTGATAVALGHYERALEGFLAWTGEPRAEARRAREAAPGFVMGHLLESYLHLCTRDPSLQAEARRALQRAQALDMNARERAHVSVIATTLRGDWGRASEQLGRILEWHPRDLLALAVAHTFDYYLGNSRNLKERVAAALPSWSASDPGHAGLLAMLAFGLEEVGEYGRAEETAFAALELEPRSIRAHHARAHVLEMQGRAAEGIRWMGERAAYWSGHGPSSTHVWWHLALHHLQLGNARHALALYDRRIAAAASPSLNELIDGSALLWRLELGGTDPGTRWRTLAERWALHAEDAFCAFNDVHAMMAFAGAGRHDLARRLIEAQRRRLARGGTNAGMLWTVGLPASRSLAAYGAADYDRAASLLRPLPEVSHRLGGSRAQHGLLAQTLRAVERKIGVRPQFPANWGLTPISRPLAARAT
jgi:tetratricopeptide (TPR) repeat protein